MGISLDDLKNGNESKKPKFVSGIVGSEDVEIPENKPTPKFVAGIVSEEEPNDEPDESNPKSKLISMIAKPKNTINVQKPVPENINDIEDDEDFDFNHKEERETVSFDNTSELKRERRKSQDAANLEEDKKGSLYNVNSLLEDGVNNPLIKNYQEKKRKQMQKFFQEQKLEKELTGHSEFDTDNLEMNFEDSEETYDTMVFRHIDLGALENGTTKRTNRAGEGNSILPKTEEASRKETESQRQRTGSDDGADGNAKTNPRDDGSGNDGSIDGNGSESSSESRVGSRYSAGYGERTARGNYERGSVKEENNMSIENMNVEEQNIPEVVEEPTQNPEPIDSVDFTEEDTYTHEEGIESMKAGAAAKKEAEEAMNKAKEEEAKKAAVTVDMEINRTISEFKSADENLLDIDEMEVEDKDDDEDEDVKERRIIIRNIISEKIKPVAKKMNLQGYTVAKKGTQSNEIFRSKNVPVGHWVLFNTGVAIDIQEIRGVDIERMEEYSRSTARQRDMFQIIYDNVVSPKPSSLDGWLKSISFNDLDNLMMAVHIGAFADSNYIPIDCEHRTCPKKYFLTDNVPIMNMVEFKDEATKNKFMNMYNNPTYNAEGWYTTEIIPISEDFAIGFKEPDLYSMVVEINYGEADFREKHSRAIAAAPFIDQIYQIDPASRSLIPIEWKTFVNNPVKTYKSRILRYDRIISRFTSDELSALEGIVAEINNRDDFLIYKRPEVVCPYCGTVKKEAKPISMAQTVFSRNQLAALAVSLEN